MKDKKRGSSGSGKGGRSKRKSVSRERSRTNSAANNSLDESGDMMIEGTSESITNENILLNNGVSFSSNKNIIKQPSSSLSRNNSLPSPPVEKQKKKRESDSTFQELLSSLESELETEYIVGKVLLDFYKLIRLFKKVLGSLMLLLKMSLLLTLNALCLRCNPLWRRSPLPLKP